MFRGALVHELLPEGLAVVVDEAELAAAGLLGGRGETDLPVEDLFFQEGVHQLVMGAVTQCLMLGVDRGGVFPGLGWALFGEAASEDLLGGPGVDGVGGGFDLEHPERHVLRSAFFGVTGAAGGALQGAELAAAFIHGHDAGLGIKLGLDRLVLVFAGDLAAPTRTRGV